MFYKKEIKDLKEKVDFLEKLVMKLLEEQQEKKEEPKYFK